MSLWFFRTPKGGKGQVWLIEIPPSLAFTVVTILVSLIVTLPVGNPLAALLCAVGTMALGYSCLLAAKISLFRRGFWISWGTRLMTRKYARLYRLRYGLIGLGAAYSLLIGRLTS